MASAQKVLQARARFLFRAGKLLLAWPDNKAFACATTAHFVRTYARACLHTYVRTCVRVSVVHTPVSRQ